MSGYSSSLNPEHPCISCLPIANPDAECCWRHTSVDQDLTVRSAGFGLERHGKNKPIPSRAKAWELADGPIVASVRAAEYWGSGLVVICMSDIRWPTFKAPKPKELDMSSAQVRSETAIETPRARMV